MTVEAWAPIGLIGLGLVALAGGRRLVRRNHPAVDVAGLGTSPGIVLFTSDACPDCLVALDRAERSGLPVRTVRYQSEPNQFKARRVGGVPVLVVIDQAGQPVAQFSGKVASGRLQKAVQRALLRPVSPTP